MMDMSTMGTGMMTVIVLYHLATFIFVVVGTIAAIKYLRS